MQCEAIFRYTIRSREEDGKKGRGRENGGFGLQQFYFHASQKLLQFYFRSRSWLHFLSDAHRQGTSSKCVMISSLSIFLVNTPDHSSAWQKSENSYLLYVYVCVCTTRADLYSCTQYDMNTYRYTTVKATV